MSLALLEDGIIGKSRRLAAEDDGLLDSSKIQGRMDHSDTSALHRH